MRERQFALALFGPAFLLLVVTTTLPLLYLVWSSTQRMDLTMPWLSGFAGLENYAKLGADSRFWQSLRQRRSPSHTPPARRRSVTITSTARKARCVC